MFPYVGFEGPLALITFPLAILFVLFTWLQAGTPHGL